jgi:hypothetical protein
MFRLAARAGRRFRRLSAVALARHPAPVHADVAPPGIAATALGLVSPLVAEPLEYEGLTDSYLLDQAVDLHRVGRRPLHHLPRPTASTAA